MGETPVGEGSSHRGMPSEPERDQSEPAVWAGVPSRTTEGQEEGPTTQEYPTQQQRLIEADKRHRKRLAA